MGGIDLGSVKATLELDASGVEQSTEKIARALQLTQEQIVALANASADQRVKMIADFEAIANGVERAGKETAEWPLKAAKGTEEAARGTAQWTEQAQRAAMQMSALHSEALKLDAAFKAAGGGATQAAKGTAQWSESAQRAATGMNSMHAEALKLNAEFDKQKGGLAGLGAAYSDYSAKIAQTGVALGIAGAAAGAAAAAIFGVSKAIANAAVETAEYVEKLDRMALATGLSVNTLQSLGKAATEAGVSTDTVAKAVGKLEVAIGNDSKAFADLGLSLERLKASSPEEMLQAVGQRLLSMTDITERNAAATKLFGRGYAEVLPALEAYLGAGDRYINLTEDQLDASRQLERALDETKTAWAELWKQLGSAAASPEVTQTISDIGAAIRDIARAIQDNREAISWFFGLVFKGPGVMLGEKLRKEFSLEGLGPIGELPKPKTQTGFGIEAPELNLPALPSSAELEAEKQNNAAKDRVWKESESAAKKHAAEMLKVTRDYNKSLNSVLSVEPETADDLARWLDAQTDGIEDFNRQFEESTRFVAEGTNEILRASLESGTLTFGQELQARTKLIRDHYGEMIAEAERQKATTTDTKVYDSLGGMIEKWKELRDAEIKATEEALRYAKISDAFGKLGAVLGGVSDLFDAIGISADSAVGKIVSGMQVAVASVQNFAAQTTTAGKIGAGLSAAANIYKTGQEKGAVAGGISGAATGAAIGTMIAPGIGTVIGGAAGLILGIAGGLRKPEYKKIMADVGKSWGVSISEGLAKEIEQIAKTNKISRSMAELLSTSKIIGESGKDPREFTKKIEDLMNAIKTGAVPAAQGMAELGKSFELVANAALEAGTVGDKALVGLLKRAREMGQVTPEMKAFAGAQLDSAVQGISKYVKAIETLSKAAKEGGEAQVRFAKIGETSGVVFGAVFQAMVSEKGITAAVDAMKSEFDSLHQTLFDSLGPEATATILGPFGGAFATLGDETLRPIFEGIDGITQAMTGLANAGYLSTDQFGAMQDATAQLFDEAVAGGADMRTALLAVAPGIQAAISAAEQFGIPLDADMVRLKQLAEQNGITFATDPQAAMLDVLVSIAQVLGADVPASARRAADSMRDLANSVPGDLNVNMNVNRHYSESYSGGGGGWGGGGGGEMPGGEVPFVPPEVFNPGEAMNEWPGYQHGSDGVQDFGPGTPAVLHGREAVVTEKQLQSMGGASVSFNPTFTVDPLMTNESRAQLSQYQIEEFVRQVRANPLFQQILRDQGLR